MNHEQVFNAVLRQNADTRSTEVNREDVMNTVVSQPQKSKYNMILFICESWTHRATKWWLQEAKVKEPWSVSVQ